MILVDRLIHAQFTAVQGGIEIQKDGGEAILDYEVKTILQGGTVVSTVESFSKAVWVVNVTRFAML